jgi:3-methyl-2-oxobutanoate hydroxymethyltransferase
MKTIREFADAKAERRKIVVITAYDAWSARMLADAPVDCLLVGDSVMMTLYGERDTLGATTEIMATHTRLVARNAPDKFIVADMPFLSMRKGNTYALDCAAALMRAGAHAVKAEVSAGMPMSSATSSNPAFRSWDTSDSLRNLSMRSAATRSSQGNSRGRTAPCRCCCCTRCGCFSMVLECVPAMLAQSISAALRIPTIGIGAGAGCDGQVLVFHDLLGLTPDFKPKFVRRFADSATLMKNGIAAYAEAVRTGTFPTEKESFR